jgi:predicted transposase YdaD
MFDYDEEKVRERIQRSSYRRGREEGRKDGRREAMAEAIRALTSDGRPAEEAMDMLHLPEAKRPRYRELLAQA